MLPHRQRLLGLLPGVAGTLASFVVLAGLLPAAAGAEAVTTDTTTTAGVAGSGVWALVIGIDEYPDPAENLHSAKVDAADMDQLLTEDGVPADHRVTLLDHQASGDAIRAGVGWLVAHSTDATTAVLFYAGHVDKLTRTTEAILGSDGALVTDAELASRLQDLHARSTWITIAGCFAGGFDEVVRPGRVLVAASDADSLSYENDILGRSYLVEYMIRQALVLGAANGSVQQAFAYAVAGIRRDFPNRVPLIDDQTSGPIDLREPPSAVAPPPVEPVVVAAAAPPPPTPPLTPPPLVTVEPVVPGPIATITTAIDKVADLRDRLVTWLTGSPSPRSGGRRAEPMETRRIGRPS